MARRVRLTSGRHLPTLTAVRLSSSDALLPPVVVATAGLLALALALALMPPLMLRRLELRAEGLAMALMGRAGTGEVGGELAIVEEGSGGFVDLRGYPLGCQNRKRATAGGLSSGVDSIGS